MKKLAVLLTIAVLTSSLTGCGCYRRFRGLFRRGAPCGPAAMTTQPYIAPVIAPQPQPVVMPQPMAQPVIVPQAQPVYVPQATAAPCIPYNPCCDPCCDPCCTPAPCCESYGYGAMGAPAGTPVYDSGWSTGCDTCGGGSLGAIPTAPPAGGAGVVDPGPAGPPPGP